MSFLLKRVIENKCKTSTSPLASTITALHRSCTALRRQSIALAQEKLTASRYSGGVEVRMTESVPVRFLIISDTHTKPLAPKDSPNAFRTPLPKADVLLHCGDLTMVGELEEYEETLDMLSHIDAELKLVIAGNHDLSLDAACRNPGLSLEEEQERNHGALEMWKGPRARAAGVTYLEEGTYHFTLKSGAKFSVYASPYTPEFFNWAFMYKRDEDRFNPQDHQVDQHTKCVEQQQPIPEFPVVDVVMTHGPPKDHLGMTTSNTDAGCKNLLNALRRARPRLHCFGHIHEGWGAELIEWSEDNKNHEKVLLSKTQRSHPSDKQHMPEYVDLRRHSATPLQYGRETLLVNAAIMDVFYEPQNSPWVVDMDLPQGSSKDVTWC